MTFYKSLNLRKGDLVRIRGKKEVYKVRGFSGDWTNLAVKLEGKRGWTHEKDLNVAERYDPEFVAGEMVRCIDAHESNNLTQNVIYKIKRTVAYRGNLRVNRVLVEGISVYYSAARFERVHSENTKTIKVSEKSSFYDISRKVFDLVNTKKVKKIVIHYKD